MQTLTRKAIVSAKKSLARHRPNKAYIKHIAAERGYMTHNEKLALTGLDVKNVLQRVNTRALNEQLKGIECADIQRLMKAFIKDINSILK